MSSVGAFTSASRGVARSGRPPRETTAAISPRNSAAAHSAAAAPVLAPKWATGRLPTSERPRSHVVAPDQAPGKQVDVEDIGAVSLLLRGEQIE